MTRVIMIGNGKGGVLKTSTTSAVAVILAASGWRVLAVDLDPQGNLGHDLGYGNGDGGAGLMAAALAGRPAPVLTAVRDRLDVIPGGFRLEGMAAALNAMARSDHGGTAPLVRSIRATADSGGYDFVLIDTPPSGSLLQEAGLEAADWLLVPSKSDLSSRGGLQDMAQRFVTARQRNPRLQLLGVFLAGVNRSATKTVSEARRSLARDLAGLPADTLLAASIRHVEAAAVGAREKGRTPTELEGSILGVGDRIAAAKAGEVVVAASTGGLAGDYESLTAEILNRIAVAEGRTPGVAHESEVGA
jgi:cellulose biosynthesis protein BcsQ